MPSADHQTTARPWTPRATVAAVVERDGRFLMVEEQVDGGLRLNQPAGHLEDGESLLQAVIRETLEETAWHFRPEALVGIYRWRHPGGETFLRFAFAGAVHDQDGTRTLDPDILRTLWLDRDTLVTERARLRSPLVLRCVDDYLAGRRYPLALLQDLPSP
ncbi:NUDIX hydrolase [Thioalkalivibrio sulfidiphilus]|uniref:NUDIX hydrolase n=1 Tax=Thioalkalivibrio sulfidiphilus TaxID=1033854 RepID=UPI0003612844|nr:NUDIX hydrolase [Thioalkalivibrio sulfidiphilus]